VADKEEETRESSMVAKEANTKVYADEDTGVYSEVAVEEKTKLDTEEQTDKMKEAEKENENKMNNKDDWVISQAVVDAAAVERARRAELNVVNNNPIISPAKSVSSDTTAPFMRKIFTPTVERWTN
jgi:hypothetical protein